MKVILVLLLLFVGIVTLITLAAAINDAIVKRQEKKPKKNRRIK